MLPGLKDKVILVTGGSSGIGLSLVNTLVTSGSQVFAVDISPAPSATELQVPNFKCLQCDLTKPGAPAAVVSACVEAYGEAIHGLCNVAGVMDDVSSVDTVSEAMWARNIGVNLTAPVFLIKAGTSGAIAGVAYTAAKHGLVGATKNVAWRFVNDNIRCNAICPGGAATNITQDLTKMDAGSMARARPVQDLHALPGAATDYKQLASNVPGPERQSNVLVFLMSDLSAEVSGAIIPVDHAWSTI
ncbi:Levodione reductase [Elsinoe australis]|uniref:Levodione reductase n=1 Tax=Elsinoe australis TaxID=40998 RepID=A0A2P8A2V6_9PEZI|nr:Levodione reductase [Elsinoe australis]